MGRRLPLAPRVHCAPPASVSCRPPGSRAARLARVPPASAGSGLLHIIATTTASFLHSCRLAWGSGQRVTTSVGGGLVPQAMSTAEHFITVAVICVSLAGMGLLPLPPAPQAGPPPLPPA